MEELVHQEREAVSTGKDHTVIKAIDDQIERAFGKKERAMGAFYEHVKEHGC